MLKLTLVTQRSHQTTNRYLDFISACARSGITAVQLREKQLAKNELLQFGKALKTLLDTYTIPLIVNDSLDLCLELDAGGLHLGQGDGDPNLARKCLGPHKTIGLTVNTLQELKVANQLPIDYIGIGAIFATQNKLDIQTIWGLEDLAQAASQSIHPIIAIGGIDTHNATLVMKAGASGIAAIGAFHNTSDPERITQTLRKIIDQGDLDDRVY